MIDDNAVNNGIGPASTTPPPAAAVPIEVKKEFSSQYKASNLNTGGDKLTLSTAFKNELEKAAKAADPNIQSLTIKSYADKSGRVEVTVTVTPIAGKTVNGSLIDTVMIEQAASKAAIGPAPNPIGASIFSAFTFNFKDPQTKVSTFRKAFEDDLKPLNMNIVIDGAYLATKSFTGSVTGNKPIQSGGGNNYIIIVFKAASTLTIADISKYINKDIKIQVSASAYLNWGFTITTISAFTNIASLEGRAPPPAAGDKSEKTIQEFNVTFNKQIGVSGGPTYEDAIKSLNDALSGVNGTVTANTQLYKVRKIYAYNPDGAYPTDLLTSGPSPGGKTTAGYSVRYVIGLTPKNKLADGKQDFTLRGISSTEFDIVKKAVYKPDPTKTNTSTLISSNDGENFVQKSWFVLRDTSMQVYTLTNTPTHEYTFILNTKNVIEFANGPESQGWIKDVMMFGPVTVTHVYTVKSTAGVVTGGDEFLPTKQSGGGIYYIIRGKSGITMDIATVQKAILKNTNVGGYLYWPTVGGHPVSTKTLSLADLDKLQALGTNPKKPSLAAQALAATAAAAAGAKAAATKAAAATAAAAKLVAEKTAALASASGQAAKDAAQKALDGAKGLFSKAKEEEAVALVESDVQQNGLVEQENAAKAAGVTVDPNGVVRDPNGNTLNPTELVEPGVTLPQLPVNPPTPQTTTQTTTKTTTQTTTQGTPQTTTQTTSRGTTQVTPQGQTTQGSQSGINMNPDSCIITKIEKTAQGAIIPPKLPTKVSGNPTVLNHVVCQISRDIVPQEFLSNVGSIGGDGSAREVFSQTTALGMPFSWIIYSPTGSNTYYYITGDNREHIDSTIEQLDAYKKILFDPALFQLIINTFKTEHAQELDGVLRALMQSTAEDDTSKDLLKRQIEKAISDAQRLVVIPSSGGSRRTSMRLKSYPNRTSKLRRKDRNSSSKRRK